MFTRFTTAFTIAVPLLCFAGAAFGADPRSANDPAVVEINGKTINLSDLDREFPAPLFQARTTYYETERKTIDAFIDKYLLEEQARKENLTVAQLIEKHVNSTIAKPPSEETLRVYYEGVDTTEPYDSLRGKIIDAIQEHRIAKAKTAYMLSLRNEAKVILRLAPPRAPLSTITAPARGPADARVTLLEYADYECPYCQQIQPAIDKLEQEYKGRVAFAYKDYPLPMHANARKAAEASRCAAFQGKYWEYHDQLTGTKQLDPAALKNHARTLKLDTAAFDKCLDNGEAAETVKATESEAVNLGVNGTPTFFVNGRYVSGNLSYEKLKSVIDEELSATQAKDLAPSREEALSKKVPMP